MTTIFQPTSGRKFKLSDLLDKLAEENLDPDDTNVTIDIDQDDKIVLLCDAEDEFDTGDRTTMLTVADKPYRCTCGANVFRKSKVDPSRFRCNGCHATFRGG